jgi:hypothetical protein
VYLAERGFTWVSCMLSISNSRSRYPRRSRWRLNSSGLLKKSVRSSRFRPGMRSYPLPSAKQLMWTTSIPEVPTMFLTFFSRGVYFLCVLQAERSKKRSEGLLLAWAVRLANRSSAAGDLRLTVATKNTHTILLFAFASLLLHTTTVQAAKPLSSAPHIIVAYLWYPHHQE